MAIQEQENIREFTTLLYDFVFERIQERKFSPLCCYAEGMKHRYWQAQKFEKDFVFLVIFVGLVIVKRIWTYNFLN